MKLTRYTPDSLVLLHRPLLLCAALLSGTLLMAGLSLWNFAGGEGVKGGVALLATLGLLAPALWFGAERVDVAFDASTHTCTVETRRLTGTTHEVYALDQIERAMVQTHIGPSDAASTHRVALVLHPGRAEDRRPLTTGYASGQGAAEVVARINSWLEERRDGKA